MIYPPNKAQDHLDMARRLVNAVHHSDPCKKALYAAQEAAGVPKKLPHQEVDTRYQTSFGVTIACPHVCTALQMGLDV